MSLRFAEGAVAANSMHARVTSLSTPVGDDGELTLGDLLPDDEAHRPDTILFNKRELADARAAILGVVNKFVPRHRELFRLRLGVAPCKRQGR